MKKIAAILATLALMLTAMAPAQASSFGPWHTVVFDPYGPAPITADQLRVKHQENGTVCDFMAHNRLDVRLIAIDVNPRACIPGKVISYS